MALTDRLDRRFGWDRLPRPLGVLTLMGVRERLRQRNLYDTGLPTASPELIEKAADPTSRSRRSVDGTFNDLDEPFDGQHRLALRSKRPARTKPSLSPSRDCSSPTRARSAASC